MNINKCFQFKLSNTLSNGWNFRLFKRSWAYKLFIKNPRNGKRSEFKGAGIAVNKWNRTFHALIHIYTLCLFLFTVSGNSVNYFF